MTGLVVFACVLLFLVLLLSIKARIILEYQDELTLTVKVMGIFTIRILPKKEKKPKGPHSMSRRKASKIKRKLEKKAAKKAEKEKQKKKDKEAKKAQKEQEKKDGVKKKSPLSIPDILELIHLAAAVLKTLVGTFFKHLRVRVARLRITVATGDAATTAIGYGAITQALPVLYPYLEQIPTFRFPELSDIHVGIDYLKEAPEVDMRMEFSLRVWHVFAVLFRTLGCALGRGIRFLFRYMKKQDGDTGHKVPTKKQQASKKNKK